VGVVALLQFDGGSQPDTAFTAEPLSTTIAGTPTSRTPTFKPRSSATQTPAVAPANSVSASTTSAPKARTARSSASLVPQAWRARCRVAPGLSRDASAAWVCAANAETTVEVVVFDDAKTAQKSLATLLADIARPVAHCDAVNGQTATWARPSHPDVVVGVFACGTTPRGAELVWTIEQSHTVVRAVRGDGEVQQLFDWWDALSNSASPL
jgi:hypothetical protein